MHHLLLQLLPFALLGLVAPVPLAIALTLLMSRSGLGKAIGYVAAATALYVLVGVLILTTSLDSVGRPAAVAAGIVLVVLALALWWVAWRQARLGRAGALPPAYFDRLDAISVRTAAFAGFAVTVVNVKQLALYLVGTSTIARADVTRGEQWAALVLFLLVFQLGQLLVVGAYVVAREPASRVLARLHDWLLPRVRGASMALSVLVGAVLLALAVPLLRG